MKMDLALNNLQRLICHKTQQTNQTNLYIYIYIYIHLPPISKTIQIRQTRDVGHCWRSKDELISDILPHTDVKVLEDKPALIYNSTVRIQDVV